MASLSAPPKEMGKGKEQEQHITLETDQYLSSPGPKEKDIHSGKRVHIAKNLQPVPVEYHSYLPKLTDSHCHMCGFTTAEQQYHYRVRTQETNETNETGGTNLSPSYFVMSVSPGDWCLPHAIKSNRLVKSNPHAQEQDAIKYRQAYGVHPMNAALVSSTFPDWLGTMRQCLIADPHSFVGEIGLDKTKRHKGCFTSHQISLFLDQFRLAVELNRPVSIHSVKCDNDLLKLLSEEEQLPPSMCLHSFCGSPETLARLIKICGEKHCELFVGLNPVTNLTKKNLGMFLKAVGVDRMLIETDWNVNDFPYEHSNVNDIGKLLLHGVCTIATTLERAYSDVVAQLVANTKRFLKG